MRASSTVLLALCALSGGVPAASADVITRTFQQDVAGYSSTADTYLRGAAPAASQGAGLVVEWDGDDAGAQNIALLRFDDIFGPDPSQVPPGAIIVDAVLGYRVLNAGDDGTCNEPLVDWDEATTFSTFGGDAGVQADEYGVIIGMAGGSLGDHTLDVTASLTAWSEDPLLNRGWIIRPTGGTNGVQFHSSEYGQVSARPRLEVSFLDLVSQVVLHPAQIEAVVGCRDMEVILAIPPESVLAAPVFVTLTTSDPSVALPAGATGDTLLVTFPMGGESRRTVSVDIGQAGAATLSTTNDAGLSDATMAFDVAPGAVSFKPASLTSLAALDVPVQVAITPGSNDTRSVSVTLTTDNEPVAGAGSSTGGSFEVVFPAGSPTEQTVNINIGAEGDALIATVNDGGMADTALPVQVISGFMFTATSDMRNYTDEDEFPLVLDAINDTGGPGVFMVCPGDIDPPQGVDSAIDAAFGDNFVWYPVVGNHEAETPADMIWIRNEFASLPYLVNSGPPGSVETTYSFDYGNAHFVAINEYYDGESDTGTDGDVVPALREWLQADLMANTRKWVFVLGHEPAYPQPDMHWGDARHVGDSLDQYPENRDAFWGMLQSHYVATYLTAHSHRYSRFWRDSVWQVDTGEARGAGYYGTFVRLLVGEAKLVLHIYRSLDTGAFHLVDTLRIERTFADFNGDGLVSLDDLPAFDSCMAGPETTYDPGHFCRTADGNDDGQVDLADFVQFQMAFSVPSAAEDLDCDGDVDAADYAAWQPCMGGPGVAPNDTCADCDIDADGDVDLDDFGAIQLAFTGS